MEKIVTKGMDILTFEDFKESLSILGLVDDEKPSSEMLILQAILQSLSQGNTSLTSKEIYSTLVTSFGASLTRPWVQRLLKKLETTGLIKTVTEGSYRKHYTADINTVISGLEAIRKNQIQEIEEQKEYLEDRLEILSKLNCSQLAQQLFETYSDERPTVKARFLKGLNEIHIVLNDLMETSADPNSKIRVILQWVQSTLDDHVENRMQKFLRTAMKGIEIQYLVGPELLEIDDIEKSGFPVDFFKQMLQVLDGFRKQGIPFTVRLYEGPRTYSHLTIGSEQMVLIITENPMTAIYVSRDFNPDMIDNVCEAFDKEWVQAIPLLDLTPEILNKYDTQVSRLLSDAIEDIREKQSNHGE
ncbi:MAG: hypothetical protein GF411_16970 [Candidatus Lokiarchaeota archaeon]|nr:hypothetical protein [Candidatus Lokiarchaeota archaeon]